MSSGSTNSIHGPSLFGSGASNYAEKAQKYGERVGALTSTLINNSFNSLSQCLSTGNINPGGEATASTL